MEMVDRPRIRPWILFLFKDRERLNNGHLRGGLKSEKALRTFCTNGQTPKIGGSIGKAPLDEEEWRG
jgi:hypothetical protein